MKKNKYFPKSKLPWRVFKIKDNKPTDAFLEIIYGDEPMIAIYADVYQVSTPKGARFVSCSFDIDKEFLTFDKAIAFAEKRIRAKIMRVRKQLQKYV